MVANKIWEKVLLSFNRLKHCVLFGIQTLMFSFKLQKFLSNIKRELNKNIGL
jgi:hypothetical protein